MYNVGQHGGIMEGILYNINLIGGLAKILLSFSDSAFSTE